MILFTCHFGNDKILKWRTEWWLSEFRNCLVAADGYGHKEYPEG